MKPDEYRQNLEYRTLVNGELRQLAERFLRGDIGVIAAARALRTFQSELEAAWPEMGEVLLALVVIDSDTDALPIG
jgi:hypothetical protein